jgi:flagellar L-ring protein precursor FlgH
MKTKSKSVFKGSVSSSVATAFVALAVLSPQVVRAGSLWREAVTEERGMFADRKARRIGDIVTVEVDEQIIFNNSKTLDRNRDYTTAPSGILGQLANSLINSVSSDKASTAAIDPARRKFPINLLPKTRADADKINILDPQSADYQQKNNAKMENTQRIRFMMAVQVIDTLPNGNLVIEGVKQVGFSNERQFISLRGIIRPTDILFGMRAATNVAPTILSRHIADARYEVVSEGVLSDTAKRGWLQRLDDKITPY